MPHDMLDISPYSVDDDLIEATRSDGLPRVRAVVPAGPMVVLGRGSDPSVELVVAACRADGVPLFRRRGGGCSVVLDPGNVVVSCTVPGTAIGAVTAQLARFSRWMIEGLGAVGVGGVTQEGISDLVIGDRKIGGSALYSSRGVVYYTTTLLVSPDVDLMERYLSHPPREPAYRRGRRHRDFVGAIEDLVGGVGVTELRAACHRWESPR